MEVAQLLGTAALVLVTCYYAWQNCNMVVKLSDQVKQTAQIEVGRRRDEQVVRAVLLDVGRPSFYFGPREVSLEVKNPSATSHVVAVELTLRGSRAPVGPPNWESPVDSVTASATLPDALPPGSSGTFKLILNDFVNVPPGAALGDPPFAFRPVMIDVRSVGAFGQQVLQRFEWRLGESTPWRLRVALVTTNVPGAEPVRLV